MPTLETLSKRSAGVSNPQAFISQSVQAVTYNDNGTSTLNNGTHNVFSLTVNGANGTTIAHSNVPSTGTRYGFELHLEWSDGTITWPASWTKGDSVNALTAGSHTITGVTIDGGASWKIAIIQSEPNDLYPNQVVLYLKGDGANGSTTITDSSPLNYTMSVFGNTQISTAQSKYGGSSILFDGSGDYLTTTGTAIGTDLFTAECWFYATNSGANAQGLVGANIQEGSGPSWEIRFDGTNGSILAWWDGPANNFFSSAGSVPLFQWNHVAMVRTSSDIRLYCNGTLAATSTTNYTNNLWRTSYVIGRTYSNNNIEYFTGNIDSVRVTKGVARYTADFNPETDTYLAY